MSLGALAFRMLFSLGLVVTLMVMTSKWIRNRNAGTAAAKRRSDLPLEVIARQRFGRNSQIAVVHAAGRELVVGVTETGINLLASVALDADGNPVAGSDLAAPGAALAGQTIVVQAGQLGASPVPAGTVTPPAVATTEKSTSEPLAADLPLTPLDTIETSDAAADTPAGDIDPADLLLFELPDSARNRDATRTASPEPAPEPVPSARKTTLDALRERTVRRSA